MRVENYLPCDRYQGHKTGEKPDFVTFFDDKTQEYYFAWIDDEDQSVIMISEGYPNEGARNNGIDSVIRNRDNEDRYVYREEEGKHYLCLRAGNNQEIARTCPFDSEAAALAMTPEGRRKAKEAAAALRLAASAGAATASESDGERREDNYLLCKEYQGEINTPLDGFRTFKNEADGQFYFSWLDKDGKVLMRSEGYPTTGARDNGLNSVLKNKDNKDRYSILEGHAGYYFVILKAGNHQEIARSCPLKGESEAWSIFPILAPLAAAAAVAAPVVAPAQEAIAPTVVKKIVLEDDYMVCEEYKGYSADANGIARFSKNGQLYFVWYDNDGKVLLRSEGFENEAKLQEELDLVMKYRNDDGNYSRIEKGGYEMRVLKDDNGREIGRSCLEKIDIIVPPVAAAVPLAAVAPIMAAAVPLITKTPEEREDDYMRCEDYAGFKAGSDGIARFSKNGLHYFVWTDKNGKVLLRSEGFETEAKLKEELDLVLRYRNDDKRYEAFEMNGYRMRILKDAKGREIGRTCLEKIVAVVPPPVVVAPPPVVAAAAPLAAAPVAEAAAGGGFKWWWLLPLLLLPLMFLLCNKCKKEEAPIAVETPVVDTVATVAETPVAPAPTTAPAACNCNESTNPIFNLSNPGTPKTLTRLGTMPEFGSLHGLTAQQVYDRMNDWYKTRPVTKQFLDGIFQAMGYADGFKSASPELFTEVEVPSGTVGNMGYSESHKTAYDRLAPTNPRDLKAFRVKSANGCDIHFMKTCGNHFFFCPQ